jgi:hypothetical protein
MIKKFENFTTKKEFIFSKINNAKICDVLPESIIYTYVQYLHGISDFVDGNLGDRIEWYPNYKLIYVSPNDLNIDEYYMFDDLKDEYMVKYQKTNYYPPIVISHTYNIIDGNHRANALNDLGIKKIKAFVGIGNDEEFNPF